MHERLNHLERKIDEMSRRLEALEERLSAIEGSETAWSFPATTAGAQQEEPRPASADAPDALPGRLSLTGRTLLVLGGGYLLRGLTEQGQLSTPVGVALGLVYAVLWIVTADRAARRELRLSALFHGIAASAVGFPLMWEAASRFGVLSPGLAAAVLALFTGGLVFVAWRHSLRLLAWVCLAAVTATATVLMGTTPDTFPPALLVVGAAVTAAWLSPARDWEILQWAFAAAADLLLLVVASVFLFREPLLPPEQALVLQLAALALYLAVFLAYNVWREAEVSLFQALQSFALLVVAYGASLLTVTRLPPARFSLGALSLSAAAAAYLLAFAVVRREERWRYYYYSTFGLVFFLAGGALVLPRPALFWAPAAVVAGWLAVRHQRFNPAIHAAVLVTFAAAFSGLLTATAIVLFAPATVAWPSASIGFFVVLAAAAACVAMPLPGERRGPKLVILAVVAAGAALLALMVIGPALAGAPGEGADVALLATVRTAVISAAALALGGASRLPRLGEASRLLYPVLLLGGLKLVVEDFPRGRPTSLFLTLVIYGTALIVAPRLARRRRRELSSTG